MTTICAACSGKTDSLFGTALDILVQWLKDYTRLHNRVLMEEALRARLDRASR